MKKLLLVGLVFIFLLGTVSALDCTDGIDNTLIAYYSMETDCTTDDANSYDLSASGDPSTSATSQLGSQSCYLDGDDYLTSTAVISAYDLDSARTVCGWFKKDDEVDSQVWASISDCGGVTKEYWQFQYRGDDTFRSIIEDATGTNYKDSASGVVATNWNFFCYLTNDDGHVVKTWNNGVDAGADTNPNIVLGDADTFILGGRCSQSATVSLIWAGFIEDVAYYDGELSDTEVGYLWAAGSGCNPISVAGGDFTLDLETDITNHSDVGMIEYTDGLYQFTVNGTTVGTGDVFNGTLYINGTLNETFLEMNLSNNNLINYSFLNFEGAIELYINFSNYNGSEFITDNLTYFLYMDGINPDINVTLLTNNSIFYKNLTADSIDFNFTAGDNNLYATNITLLNSSDVLIWQQFNESISGSLFSYAKTLDLQTNDTGLYKLKFEAWDDHTKQDNIKPIHFYEQEDAIFIDEGSISFQGDIKTGTNHKGEPYTYFVLSPDGIKYKFKITFEEDSTTQQLIIETYDDLTYLPESDYLGHFVYFSGQRWIDLLNPNIQDVEVGRLASNRYQVNITLYEASDEIEFNSIGDLNYQEETYLFNISDSFFIYAQDAELNTTINEFNATLYNSTFSQTQTTTTGVAVFNITSGNYSLNLTSSGYIAASFNNINASEGGNYTGSLNVSNAFKVYIRDQLDLDLITQLVELEFIGTNSSNYTTTTGVKYITDLPPDDYIIRYTSSGYQDAFYYFTLVNGTNIEFTIYMLDNTSSDEVTATVIDEVANTVADAYVHVQRYDLNTNNYNTVEIVKTNYEGQAKLHVTKNEEFYIFLVYYGGVLKKQTTPTYIYDDDITLQITLGEEIAQDFYTIGDVTYSLTFNEATQNFRFTYADPTNTITNGSIYLYWLNSTHTTFINTTSSTAASGTLLLFAQNVSGRTYRAVSYITVGGTNYFVADKYYQFKPETLDADRTGLFYVMLLCLLFATLAFWDLSLAVILTPLPLVFASIMHLIEIPFYVTVPIEILAIIIAIIISRK